MSNRSPAQSPHARRRAGPDTRVVASTPLFSSPQRATPSVSPLRPLSATRANDSAVAADPRVVETARRRRPSMREMGASLTERIVNTVADVIALVRLCLGRR